MRHRVDHRKLGRTTEHRLAMLRNQAISLFRHDRIQTTLEKAKELRRFAEKLITLAKKDTLHSRRIAAQKVSDPEVLQKLFATLGPLYANRPGGYTRILKLGTRRGDGAQVAILELVGREPKIEGSAKPKKGAAKKAEKPTEKKAEAAEAKPAKKTRAKAAPKAEGESAPKKPRAKKVKPAAEGEATK